MEFVIIKQEIVFAILNITELIVLYIFQTSGIFHINQKLTSLLYLCWFYCFYYNNFLFEKSKLKAKVL